MTFKRRVLSALGKDELQDVARNLELDVTSRMTVEVLVDVVAKSKRASIAAIVQESMSRDTLKAICLACGVDDTGKEKATLVERILVAGGVNRTRSKVAAGGAAILPGLDEVPAKKPTKAKGKGKSKKTERRRGVTEEDAAIAGTLKAALQQFALGAAGGYTGRDAHLAFSMHLLECFGWKDGRPEGAEIPRRFSIADAGQRVEREVALWWRERSTLMEVAAHDAVLDFAWKDLVRVCLQLEVKSEFLCECLTREFGFGVHAAAA